MVKGRCCMEKRLDTPMDELRFVAISGPSSTRHNEGNLRDTENCTGPLRKFQMFHHNPRSKHRCKMSMFAITWYPKILSSCKLTLTCLAFVVLANSSPQNSYNHIHIYSLYNLCCLVGHPKSMEESWVYVNPGAFVLDKFMDGSL